MASPQRSPFGPRSSPGTGAGPRKAPGPVSPGRAHKRAVPGAAAPLGPGRAGVAELGPRRCGEGGWRKAGPAGPAEDIGEALLGTALGPREGRGETMWNWQSVIRGW